MKKNILLLLIFTQTIAFAQQPVRDALLGTYTGRRINFISLNSEEPITISITAYPTDTGKIIYIDQTNGLIDTARVVLNDTDTLLWDDNQTIGFVQHGCTNLFYYDPQGSQDDPVWIYDCGNSTETIENIVDKIIIYPNPVSNFIHIAFTNILTFEIINSTGQVIKKSILNTPEIDFSEFPTGIYFIRLSNNKTSITRKIIKN